MQYVQRMDHKRPQSISVVDMWFLANSQQNLNLIRQRHHWSHSGINASIHAKQATSANIWTLCSNFVGSTLNCFGQILERQNAAELQSSEFGQPGSSRRERIWAQDTSVNGQRVKTCHWDQLVWKRLLVQDASGCIRMHQDASGCKMQCGMQWCNVLKRRDTSKYIKSIRFAILCTNRARPVASTVVSRPVNSLEIMAAKACANGDTSVSHLAPPWGQAEAEVTTKSWENPLREDFRDQWTVH